MRYSPIGTLLLIKKVCMEHIVRVEGRLCSHDPDMDAEKAFDELLDLMEPSIKHYVNSIDYDYIDDELVKEKFRRKS